jgi:Zn-finger nucleic acid-binding protein
MICPRCIEKMSESNSRGINTHTCLYCDGTWINSVSLKAMLKNEQNPQLKAEFDKSNKFLSGRYSNRCCPSCRDQNLIQYIVHDVEIDICAVCKGLTKPYIDGNH